MILKDLPEPTFTTSDGRTLKKKVEILYPTILFGQKVVKLMLNVLHFEGENLVTDGFYAPYAVPERIATNSNIIDKTTGVSGGEILEENQIGEYDYFAAMKRSDIQAMQSALIQQGIQIDYLLPDDDNNEERILAICEIQVLQLWQKGIFK